MTKQEVIIEIMNVFDKLEQYETLIKFTEINASNSEKGCVDVNNPFNHSDYIMIELGKKQALDKGVSYWREVTVNYDEDNDIYKCQSYESWEKKVVNKSNIPDEMSLDEFRVYFRKELQEIYEKEKTKALNEAKGIENVEDE